MFNTRSAVLTWRALARSRRWRRRRWRIAVDARPVWWTFTRVIVAILNARAAILTRVAVARSRWYNVTVSAGPAWWTLAYVFTTLHYTSAAVLARIAVARSAEWRLAVHTSPTSQALTNVAAVAVTEARAAVLTRFALTWHRRGNAIIASPALQTATLVTVVGYLARATVQTRIAIARTRRWRRCFAIGSCPIWRADAPVSVILINARCAVLARLLLARCWRRWWRCGCVAVDSRPTILTDASVCVVLLDARCSVLARIALTRSRRRRRRCRYVAVHSRPSLVAATRVSVRVFNTRCSVLARIALARSRRRRR
jgi:hypothetical protein